MKTHNLTFVELDVYHLTVESNLILLLRQKGQHFNVHFPTDLF
jgi:hypothetical protein